MIWERESVEFERLARRKVEEHRLKKMQEMEEIVELEETEDRCDIFT